MSEEPKATPLRLKAQPSPSGGPPEPAPGQTSSSVSGTAGAGDADGPIRLKLKPRPSSPEPSAPAPSPPATTPEETAPTQASVPKIRIKPTLPVEPEAKAEDQATEPDSVQNALFLPESGPTEPPPPPASPGPSAPALDAEHLAAGAPSVERTVAPFLVIPSLSQTSHSTSRPPFAVGAPKVPHIKGPEGTVTDPEPLSDPVKRKEFKIGIAFVGSVIGVGLIVGAFALWKALSNPSAKPVYVARSPASVTVKPTPSSAQKAPTSLSQLQSLVAATHNAEQARVDALAAGHEPPSVASQVLGSSPGAASAAASQGQPASSAPIRSAPAPVTSASSNQVSRPPAEVVRVAAPPEASPAFRRFVSAASIPGVFQGNPPRAIINGCTVQAGELADRELQITFVRIDANKKTITFRDPSGAEVSRRY